LQSYGICLNAAGDQCRQFLQTSMDVDLDKSGGLTGRAGGVFDAETLQFDEADHAGLSGLQPAEQIVNRGGAYRSSAVIIDRYVVVECLGLGHGATPSLGTPVAILGSRCYSRLAKQMAWNVGRQGILSSVIDPLQAGRNVIQRREGHGVISLAGQNH
jgi:hypothetical protein